MASDYKTIISDIQNGKVAPIYLLHGEESFFIDKIAQSIEALIPEESKDFNLSLLYGEDVDYQTILSHCGQYPMMAERRVVSIREAQKIKNMPSLENYVDHPVPTTVLVLSHKHKKIDGRSSFAKKLKKQAVVFEAKKLYDNQVEAWISGQLKTRGLKYDIAVPSLLNEHLGKDLLKIEGELEKVYTNLNEGDTLTPGMIEKWVGISRDYNVFELQKAMSYGQMEKVMKIVKYFGENVQTHHPLMIISSLYGYFSKLMMLGMYRKSDQRTIMQKTKIGSPYILKEYQLALQFWNGRKVMRAFELLSEYDLKVKGVNNRRTPPDQLLQEMIYRMMTG